MGHMAKDGEEANMDRTRTYMAKEEVKANNGRTAKEERASTDQTVKEGEYKKPCSMGIVTTAIG